MPLLRLARGDEAASLAALYRRSVLVLGPRAYAAAQVAAWAAFADDLPAIRAWLDGTRTWLLDEGGEPGGFCAVAGDGEVRALYLRPESAGRGLALRLLAHALDDARSRGCSRFTTHASHLSRPVFERAGFRVVEPERVVRGGLQFERFRMST
ncbi:GNAT family N-acetyltransferase [Caldimonas tepidiphila]|uniref:GNAT family N-acetyltransferase n=1 Tax=Caldimonas tepidiphila TaxID=2315841 RepID=UPI000E5AC8EB|nr:GNAT family N-acetyltransferase [Caldimonas tepidiphila]